MKIFDVVKMQRRINSLELELETLKSSVGSEAFKLIMKKLEEPDTVKRLKEQNAKLRITNKSLKEENAKLRNGDKNEKKRSFNKTIYRSTKSITTE